MERNEAIIWRSLLIRTIDWTLNQRGVNIQGFWLQSYKVLLPTPGRISVPPICCFLPVISLQGSWKCEGLCWANTLFLDRPAFCRSSFWRHIQGASIVSSSTGNTYAHLGDLLYELAVRHNVFSLKSLLPRFYSIKKKPNQPIWCRYYW